MVWNGNACEQPSCTSPFVWNGTACVYPNCPGGPTHCFAALRPATELTYATAPPPAEGMIYDALGTQVKIPAEGYRHVGYAHSLTGDAVVEPALNPASTIATNAVGAVTAFNVPSFKGTAISSANQFSVGIGTASLMDFGTDPVSGISWGRWQGGQINQTALASVEVTAIANGAGSTHWFVSPTQTQAITLPLTGIIPYTLAGGTTPTDAGGSQGRLNSATLTANFTNATVDVGLNVSMPATVTPSALPAITLNASALGIPILPGANFKTTSPSITCPACAGIPSGIIAGQFSGPGGLGAGIGYGFNTGTRIITGISIFHK